MRSKITKLLVLVLILQTVYVPGTNATQWNSVGGIVQGEVMTTTPPAIEVEIPDEAVSNNVFDYGLFAGNPRANLEFSGYVLDVDGNVRANNGIRTNCQDLIVTGSLEATNTIEAVARNFEVGKEVTGCQHCNFQISTRRLPRVSNLYRTFMRETCM